MMHCSSMLGVCEFQRGVCVLSWHFESYSLVPGCHTFLILHGIAETFGLDAELA